MISPQYYVSSIENEHIDKAVAWSEAGYDIAMLTLIGIEGSGPYPIGSQMIVRDDGESKGQLTGGCAETALVQQALTAIKNKQNTTERYGLNSRFFDIKLPCGSGLDIEFDVQTGLDEYLLIAGKLNNRQAVQVSEAKTYLPAPRILLFGQGPIIERLIELANNTGFDVLLFDHQKIYNFQNYCDAYTAVVSLFHEHEHEAELFLNLLDQPCFYFGALGSRETHRLRLETSKVRGVGVKNLSKIDGPIGIDINSQTPSQIAISILAEIIAVMNKDER